MAHKKESNLQPIQYQSFVAYDVNNKGRESKTWPTVLSSIIYFLFREGVKQNINYLCGIFHGALTPLPSNANWLLNSYFKVFWDKDHLVKIKYLKHIQYIDFWKSVKQKYKKFLLN